MDAKTPTPEQTIQALQQQVGWLEEKLLRLSRLLGVGRAVYSELDLNTLLHVVMREVTHALEADRSTLYMVDWGRKELWSTVAQGTGEIRIPIDKGLAGHVAVSGRTEVIDNAYEDPRFNPEVDAETGYRTRTMVVMPIRSREGEVIAVIQVLNKHGGVFTAEDQDLLEALGAQIGVALENARLYSELRRMFDSFIQTLAAAIDAKHRNTSGHSSRVRLYSLAIADELGLSSEQKEILSYASIMHDLGKIGIDDRVLTKPGYLTDEEYAEMKKHAVYTRQILEQIHLSYRHRELPQLAGAHHERLNGTGYPEGLEEADIPLTARIIAVADVFDALTYWREYRNPMDGDKALETLKRDSGTLLDEKVVKAFEAYYRRVNLGHALVELRQKEGQGAPVK